MFLKPESFNICDLQICDSGVLLVGELLLKATIINRHRKRLIVLVENEIVRVPKDNYFFYHGVRSWLLNINYPKISERRTLGKELSVQLITVSPLLSSQTVTKVCAANA